MRCSSLAGYAADLLPLLPSWQFPNTAGEGRGRRRGGTAETGRKPKKAGARRATNRVILFGRIRELQLYRAEVLRDRGFSVIVPSNKEEAVAAIKRCDFEAAILTYTLSSDTVEELAELLRQTCPGRPLICISNTGWLDRKVAPDEMVVADQGPPALLEALRRVLRR